MPESKSFILGFDPGGKGRSPRGKGDFGWSLCSEVGGFLQPHARTGLATDAWDAISKVKKELESLAATPNVLAAGIDAPLFWSEKGNREVDDVLERAMKATGFPPPEKGGRIVQAVNSLRGACVVQGPLLAKFLSENCCDLKITESHPKVLHHLLQKSGQPDIVNNMVQDLMTNLYLKASLTDHERDATLCAVAAWAMTHHQDQTLPNWQNLYMKESCPIQPFGTPVSYWMPIP